jgi:E3 ubiquitin-protein ligase CBL
MAAEAARSWLMSKLRIDDTEDRVRCVVDSKITLKLAKYLQQIIIFAANKKYNLKNSPPYLHGIVTETGEFIHQIFKKNTLDELKANEYINIFLSNLIVHCKKIVKTFKDAKEEMEVGVFGNK